MSRTGISRASNILDQVGFLLVFVAGYFQILFSVSALTAPASALFKVSLVLVFLWFIEHVVFCFICRQTIKRNGVLFALLASIAFFSILSALLSSGFKIADISFFNQIICFLASLALLYLVTDIRLLPFSVDLLFVVNLLACFTVLALFSTGVCDKWYLHVKWHDLNLNFSNSNPAGEFLSLQVVISVVGVCKSRPVLLKVASAVVSLPMFVLLVFTSSRGPFIAFVVAFLLVAVFRLLSRKKPSCGVLSLIATSPAFYAALLILLLFLVDATGIGKDAISGLSLYTRYYIWCTYLRNLISSGFVGIYASLCSAGSVVNYHNSHLGTLVFFGPLVFVCFCLFLYRILKKQAGSYDLRSWENLLVLGAEAFVIFLGSNEGGVFICSGGFYVLGISVFAMMSKTSSNVVS